jgi:Fusaric acid resistance protein-like
MPRTAGYDPGTTPSHETTDASTRRITLNSNVRFMMPSGWTNDLFKLGPGPLPLAVALRAGAAVGVPLLGGVATGNVLQGVIAAACALLVTLADIGTTRPTRVGNMVAAGFAILAGGTLGALLGGTTYADETLVLLSAFIAGWVSASHPGIATVARFCAVATAVGAGMEFTDPTVAFAGFAGTAIAITSAFLDWWLFGLPPQQNLVDWRAGLRLALGGAGAGPRYAMCYAVTACVALLVAELLGMSRPYWATVAVLVVMRREGTVSLQMIVQYMIGTLAGILLAALIVRLIPALLVIALIAVACAAFARLGLALNPALGFMGFTAFFMLALDVALQGEATHIHLLSTRLYDVAVGCVLALLGTLVATKWTGTGNATVSAEAAREKTT